LQRDPARICGILVRAPDVEVLGVDDSSPSVPFQKVYDALHLPPADGG
jgi:hypothetical protein